MFNVATHLLPKYCHIKPQNKEAFTIISENLPMRRKDPKLMEILHTHRIIKNHKQLKLLKRPSQRQNYFLK